MKAIFASFFSFISVCVFSQTMIVDSTFNIGTGFSNGLRGTVSSISIQRDEKIIVGGNFVSFMGIQ